MKAKYTLALLALAVSFAFFFNSCKKMKPEEKETRVELELTNLKYARTPGREICDKDPYQSRLVLVLDKDNKTLRVLFSCFGTSGQTSEYSATLDKNKLIIKEKDTTDEDTPIADCCWFEDASFALKEISQGNYDIEFQYISREGKVVFQKVFGNHRIEKGKELSFVIFEEKGKPSKKEEIKLEVTNLEVEATPGREKCESNKPYQSRLGLVLGKDNTRLSVVLSCFPSSGEQFEYAATLKGDKLIIKKILKDDTCVCDCCELRDTKFDLKEISAGKYDIEFQQISKDGKIVYKKEFGSHYIKIGKELSFVISESKGLHHD